MSLFVVGQLLCIFLVAMSKRVSDSKFAITIVVLVANAVSFSELITVDDLMLLSILHMAATEENIFAKLAFIGSNHIGYDMTFLFTPVAEKVKQMCLQEINEAVVLDESLAVLSTGILEGIVKITYNNVYSSIDPTKSLGPIFGVGMKSKSGKYVTTLNFNLENYGHISIQGEYELVDATMVVTAGNGIFEGVSGSVRVQRPSPSSRIYTFSLSGIADLPVELVTPTG